MSVGQPGDKQADLRREAVPVRRQRAPRTDGLTGDFSLRLKINHPAFEFEVSTRDARTLDRIKEILELVPVPEETAMDDDEAAFQEVALKLTENFTANREVALLLRELLRRGQPYRVSAVDIPTTAALDMETGARSVRVRRADVQRNVRALVAGVDASAVRSGIIHICGGIDADDKRLIADYINHHFKTADLRAFQSPRSKDQTGALVECVFFGPFPDEEE